MSADLFHRLSKLVNANGQSWAPWRTALLLVGTLALGTTTKAQEVFNETFTGGVSTAGFTTTQSLGTCGWVYNNPHPRAISGAGFDSDFAIFDSDDCGSTGESTGELLSPVFDASTASNFILTFDQAYEYCCTSIATVDVWDGTTWNNVYTLPASSVGYPDPAVSESFNISAAANGYTAAQIRFQYNGDYAYWWALDNIVLSGANCVAPAGLAVTGITTIGGTISWTDNGSTAYGWAVTTGDLPDGTNELAEGDGAITTITGLTSNTSYTAWVRADCGDGSFSNWSLGMHFTTHCDASEVPYYEDFSSVTPPALPGCMSIQTVSGSPWTTYNFPPSGMTAPVARISATPFGSPVMDSWLYTTGLNLTAGVSYQLIYKYRNTSTFSTEAMSAAYGTGASEADMVNALIDHPSIGDNTLHIDTLNFTPATDDVYYLGFKCHSIASQSSLYLDDISVTITPTCFPPMGITASNVSTAGADLSWTDNASGSYNYEVRTSGAAGSGPTGLAFNGTVTSGTPAINVAQLTSATTYTVYVQGSCTGGSDLSAWSAGVNFTPGLVQVGAGITTNTNFPIYSCYNYSYSQQIYLASELGSLGQYITKIAFKYTSGGTTTTNWNDWTVYMGNTSQTGFDTTTSWIPLANLQSVFSGTVTPLAGEWMQIDLTSPFLWDGTSNIAVAVDENASGYSCTAAFQSYTASGPNRGILYYADGTNPDPASPPAANTRNSNLAQIQFIGGDMPSCIPPTSLEVSNVLSTSADLSWTASTSDPANGYQWEVRSSGVAGSGATGLADSGTTAAGVTTASTITLDADSTYILYVRSDCGSDLSPWAASSSFLTGYCVASGSSTTYYLTDFSTTGGSTNITNTGSGPSTNGYGDFTSMVLTSYPGGSVDFTAGFASAFSTYYFYIWADLNNDLDFTDPSDSLFATSSYVGSPFSGTFTIPVGTPAGTYRMRVRNSEIGTVGPCGAASYGETEDYTLVVVAQDQCSGMPDPGATVGPDTICAGAPFTVTIANPSIEGGLSYQWQIATDGSTWTDAPGVDTAAVYSATQTVETSYRVLMICSTGDTAISTPLSVAMASPTECYCASNFTDVSFEYVTNVNYAGIDNTSAGVVGGPVDFTDQVAEVSQGDTHTLSVTVEADAAEYVYAFIDWNQNGILDDAGEVYTLASSISTPGPFTLDVVTPADAVAGNTRMRVLLQFNGTTPDPCANAIYGEAEDYTVHVTGSMEDCEGVANGPALPGTPCVTADSLDGVWSENCDCVANAIVDCENVAGGPALPGTACISDSSGFGGIWSATCVCVENVGVDEINGTSGFAIYPNPASTTLYISTSTDAPMHVKVYDMVGTLVMDKDMVHQLDITKLATGSYTLVATDAKGGNARHARFMKQ